MSAFGAFGSTQPQQQPQQQAGGIFGGGGTFGSNQTTAPATGAPLFGNNTQQNPAAGGNLFGQPSTSAQPSGTAGGIFGSTQPSGTGLFGNTAANQQQPGGGMFGSTAQQNAPGAAPTTGLFGQTQPGQTGAAGSNLFGNTTNTSAAAPGTGLFGNTNPTTTGGTGLFGNTATNTAAPSGGLFGNTTTAPGTSGGGLFGNTTNTGSTTGLFGNTAANTTTAPSGGLFGSTTTAPATGGGLFGNTAAPSTGTTGLFGSTAAAPGTTGGGLFGTAQPAASTTQPSFFGASAAQAPSLFASTQPQQNSLLLNLGGPQRPAAVGLFAGSTLGASNIGGSGLGASSNLFASRPGLAPSPQQDAQVQFAQLTQRIEGIAQAWNSSHPQCRFQHYFYNLVDPAHVQLYGRPPNATNDALWQKAVRDNPDPSCFVPVIATGFDDLQKRVEAQTQQAAQHQEKIKDLQTRIAALTRDHQLKNASRLQRAAALQTQLTHRVLKLVQHLHLLVPALRSSALRPEEEALRGALEEIDEEVRRPGGTGRIRGKLNELWALVGAVTAARERDRRGGGVEWAVVDEEGLAQIAQILADEQAGLVHLTKLLQKDMKDLAVIQGSTQEEDPDTLMSSTTTFRASTL